MVVRLGTRTFLLKYAVGMYFVLSKHRAFLRLLEGIIKKRIKSVIRVKSRKNSRIVEGIIFFFYKCVLSLKNNYFYWLDSTLQIFSDFEFCSYFV